MRPGIRRPLVEPKPGDDPVHVGAELHPQFRRVRVGHSYIVYGPLANGATTLMFEGIPTYPDSSRCWQVIDKHAVNIFYTAPTAIRQLMGQGNDFVTCTSRASLKILGTVGEPINPEAWEWYHQVVGERRCPIVDTWWQTETGGIMITPLPIWANP